MSSEKICGITKRHFRRLVQAECAKPKKIKLNKSNIEKSSFSSIEYLDNENSITDKESRLTIHSDDNDQLHENEDSEKSNNNLIEINFNENLINWAKKNYINEKALNELLKVLIDFGLNIPNDARTILETPKTIIAPKVLNSGKYSKIGIEELIERVKILERNQAKSNIIIEKLKKKIFPNSSATDDDGQFFNLPLDTYTAVENLDHLLKDDNVKKKFKNCVQSILGPAPPQNLPDVFSKILSDKALLEFNLTGAKHKKSFIGLTQVYNGIYDAIKNDDFNSSNFDTCMKIIFKQSHRRIHSANFRQRHKIYHQLLHTM